MSNDEPTVLYIDDELMSLKYFEQQFKNYFPIYTAPNAKKGLELLDEYSEEIGVLMVDQRMLGIKGIEILKKTCQIKPEIVRILVTGYSDTRLAIDAINDAKIFKFIEKPWNCLDMVRILDEGLTIYLEQRRMIQTGFHPDHFEVSTSVFESDIMDLPYKQAKKKYVDLFGAEYFERLLAKYSNNLSKASEACGINRKTIQRFKKSITLNRKNRQ